MMRIIGCARAASWAQPQQQPRPLHANHGDVDAGRLALAAAAQEEKAGTAIAVVKARVRHATC